MAVFSVILERGSLGNRVWDDATKKRAESRAYSLAELHGLSLAMVQEHTNEAGDTTYVVPASAWYDK